MKKIHQPDWEAVERRYWEHEDARHDWARSQAEQAAAEAGDSEPDEDWEGDAA